MEGSAPRSIHSIPVISKTPVVNEDGETPVAGGKGCRSPVTPPLWEGLRLHDVNDSFGDEAATPLTPLELRAMGPPLMPQPSDKAYAKREEGILKARAEATYDACIMMNQIYVSDSLASKRSLWLDVSAKMWQQIASCQADDAMRTAQALKEKEELYGNAADLKAEVASLRGEAAEHADLIDTRKQTLASLDAKIESKSLERRIYADDLTDDEHQQVSQNLIRSMKDLRRKEQHLAERKVQMETELSHSRKRIEQCKIWESKAQSIQTKEVDLLEREAEMDQHETEVKALDDALQKERAEYASARERLLFEYADIAEREAAAEENMKTAQSTWRAACQQQADTQNYEARTQQLLTNFTACMTSLSDIYSEHSVLVVEAWTNAAPTSAAHYAKLRAAARVVPSPRPGAVPTTPTLAGQRSMSPKALMSPTVIRHNNNLSSVEQSLRERYSISYSQPAPTPQQSPQKNLGDRLRDKLREETRRMSYEARLKELLKETQAKVQGDTLPVHTSEELSLAEDWCKNRSPSRSTSPMSARGPNPLQPTQSVQHQNSLMAPVGCPNTSLVGTPRRCSAPRRDLTSPKVGTRTHHAVQPLQQHPQHPPHPHPNPHPQHLPTSVDAVFEQIREMEDFLSNIHAPRAHGVMPPIMSEAP